MLRKTHLGRTYNWEKQKLITFDYNAAVAIWATVNQLLQKIQDLTTDECPMAQIGDVKAFSESLEKWHTDLVGPLPENLSNPNLMGDQFNPLIGAHSKKDMWYNFGYCMRTGRALLNWLLKCFNLWGPGSKLVMPHGSNFRFDFERVYPKSGGIGYVNAIQSRAVTIVTRPLYDTVLEALVDRHQQMDLQRINEKALVGFAHLGDYVAEGDIDSDLDELNDELATPSEDNSSSIENLELGYPEDEDFAQLNKAIVNISRLEDPQDLQVVRTDNKGRNPSSPQPPITGFQTVNIHYANAQSDANKEGNQEYPGLETTVTDKISTGKDEIISKVEDLIAWGYCRGAEHATKALKERLNRLPKHNRLDEFLSLIDLDALIASVSNSNEPSPALDADPQPPRYSPVEHFERNSSKRECTSNSHSHPYTRMDKTKIKANYSTNSHA